jgi:hypothetical protein
MVRYYLPNLLTGCHSSLDCYLKTFPFVITQQRSQIARAPVFFAVGVDLLARCCGAIGSAVISGDTGSLWCARKPFCSPFAQLSLWRQSMFPSRMCLPVRNEPIGGKARPQRLARNARLPTAPSLEVTIHGLPVSFAQAFGFDVMMAA